MAFLANQ